MALGEREIRVCEAIERRARELLSDLRLHVGIPTGGNNKAGLDESRERLTGRMKALGAEIELVPGAAKPSWLYGGSEGGYVPPVAVGRVKRGGGGGGVWGRPILLAGHLDTVHDPASAFRELTIASDGRTATGPGCVDMKGGLVIAMAALEALEEAGERVNWSFLLNSDEETGSYHSEAALRAEAQRVLAQDAGAIGLALEPAAADGSLVVERAGSGQFMVEVFGKSAHVGRDFASGVSAVTALARCLVEIAGLPAPERQLIVNVGPIESNRATNVVPDRARAWGNVRFQTWDGAKELEEKLRAIAARHSGASGLPRLVVHTSFNRPAKPMIEGTRSLAAAARSAAEDLGQRLPFGKTAGVCDGNILQDAGLPCIDTVGVRGGGLHTPQEWIELPSLVERCQLLAVLMMRIGGGQ
ncbi:MAG: M20/M25/M40 family metallo-hydrolase [Phycisphaerales bacterium]|nr:M20/M25/M40 family metallo-hydrolase [Phycisphaerales bacterium]